MFLRKAFYCVGVSLASFCFGTLPANGAVTDTSGIAVINGQVLDNRELEREMKRYRSAVFNDYVKQLGLTSTVDFWNTKYNGVNPLEKLKEKALEALKRVKVQEGMLKSKNLWPYNSYQELLTDWIANNEKRKIAVQKNEVIYGPVEFSERSFFDYQFSNAVIKLKELMEGREIPLSQKRLTTHFEKMKKDTFKDKDYTFSEVEKRVKAHYLEEKYELYVDSLLETTHFSTKPSIEKHPY